MTAAVESLRPVFDALLGDLPLPALARRVIGRILRFDDAKRLCGSVLRAEKGDASAPRRLIESLGVECRAAPRDLEQIPRCGALIVVANHPFGILEGAILANLLGQIRSDVRILGTKILSAIPEASKILIPVDTDRGANSNAAAVRMAVEHLRGGGCLVVFPAGRVSHFQVSTRRIADPEWSTSTARMVAMLARHGVPVQVVPVFVKGSNSFLFHAAGIVNGDIRTAMLVRELLNKRNRSIEVRIGSAISARRLLAHNGPTEQTEYLRWRTYVLERKNSVKPRTSLPLQRRSAHGPVEIDPPVDAFLMEAEIKGLPADALLTHSGDLEAWMASPAAIPHTLREIGRLREVTFRRAGEGTGNSTDLDSFDRHYLHLFLWNAAQREIVGAYRLGPTDQVPELYTSTLFRYDERFLDRIGPAIELGRSFVRDEHQRSFAPLLTLWRGIGEWVARHPRYKILFGPVSISNDYQAASRDLMVAFLERRSPLGELARLISSRTPFRLSKAALPAIELDMEDISDVVADLEPEHDGVPVLLRQYLKLGGQLLGFNVDPQFSNVADGLILVDLTKTEPKLLERYLGKASAEKFVDFWRSRAVS